MACVVKDSMILIHLAKMSILEICCSYFEEVLIPELVYEETVTGKEKYQDSFLIANLINKKIIKIKKLKDKKLLEKAEQFNIKGGEAHSVSLYWQEKADFLATDDDNVRKKKDVLNLRIIGTPAILLTLYKHGKINQEKTFSAIKNLKETGWFHSAVLDKISEEVK